MSLQRSYFSDNLHRHSFQPDLLEILEDRMDLQMNAPENNSCIAVINSMTENYPLAAIDCSLTSDNITFLCENSLSEVNQYWSEMQLNLINKRAVLCKLKWKAIAIFCVNMLPYKKGLTASGGPDNLRWDTMKICKSISISLIIFKYGMYKIVFGNFQGALEKEG